MVVSPWLFHSLVSTKGCLIKRGFSLVVDIKDALSKYGISLVEKNSKCLSC